MAETFSGFLIGFVLALLSAPAAALWAVRTAVSSVTFRRLVPPGTNPIALTVVIFSFGFLLFTGVGLVFGMVLFALNQRHPESGLGSPNGAFTLFVLMVTAIAVVPLALAWPAARRYLLASGLLLAGLFGWLLPYLASWAPDSG